jgi:ABC-type lipoprotein export system ATPase subunit
MVVCTTSKQQTLLVVTHDQEFAGTTHRIIEMEEGRIMNHEKAIRTNLK